MKINIRLSRRLIYLIIISGLLALATMNFVGWLFLRSLKSELTASLKKQLLQVGQLTTRLLNGNDLEKIFPGMESTPEVLYYQQLLYDLKINHELENIVVIDPTGNLLIDFRLNFQIGDSLQTFPLQPELLRKAAMGEVTEASLLHLDDQYFLSVYLPVFNDLSEISSILVIDAPAKFFVTLNRFETGALYLGTGSLIIFVLFSAIILSAARRLFRAEDQIRQQEQLAHLGQMAATVAHEIRNPLSIMKGTAEVLRKKYPEISDEMLSFIPEEIDRLNRLVNDFLQFARQHQLDISLVMLDQFFNELKRQLPDPRVTIQSVDTTLKVSADQSALKQVLINLIQNSLEAIRPDSKVLVRAFMEDNRPYRLILEVSDNGKGIPADDLPRIYEPFFSSKASGSGLGLTICKQLVEQMGGELVIHSQENSGTTAQIKFKKV